MGARVLRSCRNNAHRQRCHVCSPTLGRRSSSCDVTFVELTAKRGDNGPSLRPVPWPPVCTADDGHVIRNPMLGVCHHITACAKGASLLIPRVACCVTVLDAVRSRLPPSFKSNAHILCSLIN
ncbi:hypothetical protein EON66_08255 [archaeon]|nr:MAG: hypothetical protein EON66_08255 [archaeon]